MKHLFFFFSLFAFFLTATAQNTITGYVRTDAGAPIADCVVSDGFSVVKTDVSGTYSFPRNDSTEFVFISVPAAYEIPVDANNLPLYYAQVPASPLNFTCDFTLKSFADGGAADRNHVMIGIADPQVQNSFETWCFGKETIQDIKEHIQTLPPGTPVYGAVVGDLVWDEYARFSEHTANLSQLGFPVFNVIGNHDHDRLIRQDRGADHYFKENYGPTYYSFNRGNIHYIALDDIEYTNVAGDKSYRHNIVDYQMEWLKKDLAFTPASMNVVFLVHAPIEGSSVANRATVYSLVNSRRNTHAISGHHHVLTNYEIKTNFYDHTLPAAGSLWTGYMGPDGAPPGYMVFQAGSTGFTSWYYKSTGFDKSHQMRVYPVNSFTNGETMTNRITANIWNYDSKWSDVSIYENGVKKLMYQYTGLDPLTYDFLLDTGDTRPNYPGSDGGTLASRNLGASATKHIFYYEPQDPNADFEVEVTDRNGITYREPVLKNLMTASFTKEADNSFYYRQDFDNCFRAYPNQYVASSKSGKCTYVQGHSPTGWYSCHSGTVIPASPSNVTWNLFNYIRIDNGIAEEGALYAYGQGNAGAPADNSPERAMGTLVSFLARNIHFGLLIENNTGMTLDGIELSYTGEMWRGGTNPTNPQSLNFSYAVNPDVLSLRKRTLSLAEVNTTRIDSLSFVSPSTTNAGQNAACDGNAPRNRTNINGKIAAKLYPGDVLLLRWEDTDDAGNDNALAIDDLVIKAIGETGSSIDKMQISNQSFYNVGTTVFFDEVPLSKVSLYDVTGHIIREMEVSGTQVDFAPVSTGVYFLKTKFGTKKLIF